MATEIKGLRTLRMRTDLTGAEYWVGQRTFTCATNAVASSIRSLKNGLFPGVGGDTAPICLGAEATWGPSGQKNKAYISASYESPRKPGRARLIARMQSYGVRVAREPGRGRVIEGFDSTDLRNEWRVVAGENVLPAFRTVLELQTAWPLAGFDLTVFMRLEGKTNASACNILNMINAAPETLACLGVEIVGTVGEDLVYVNFNLAWSGAETWNQKVWSQRGCYVLQSRAVLDSDYADTGARRDVHEFVLGKAYNSAGVVVDSPAESRILYTPSTDMQLISGLARW